MHRQTIYENRVITQVILLQGYDLSPCSYRVSTTTIITRASPCTTIIPKSNKGSTSRKPYGIESMKRKNRSKFPESAKAPRGHNNNATWFTKNLNTHSAVQAKNTGECIPEQPTPKSGRLMLTICR